MNKKCSILVDAREFVQAKHTGIGRVIEGRTFQPSPSIEAKFDESGFVFAPPPTSPVGFSAEIERVLILDKAGKLVNPKKGFMIIFFMVVILLIF